MIGYIANELLENTMKFHCVESDVPISITLHLCPHELFFYISNCVDAVDNYYPISIDNLHHKNYINFIHR